METGQINFPLYIQWNFTTVRPYPPAIKTQATRRLGKGGLFHLKGEVGKKRVNIWSKSTRSDIISSAAVALFLLQRRQQGVRAFRGSSGCCVAVSADDRRMGEGAPRDALFVTYPPHLPNPPFAWHCHTAPDILWLILPRVETCQGSPYPVLSLGVKGIHTFCQIKHYLRKGR